MANLAPVLKHKFTDANDNPLSGGKLYSYAAGTSTPLATYTDSGALTPNANPIILDANGECNLWLGDSAYKFVLKDAADVVQWTVDNVSFPVVDNGFTTGDVKLSLKSAADAGWVLMDDKSIGNAASSATGRANADTESLYTLLWTNISDTYAPVSTGRGASAASDFAAGKRLTLPKTLGRALCVAGAGSGLTSRALGLNVGAETHQLTTAEMPSHTHTQDAHNHTQDAHAHNMLGTNFAGGTANSAARADGAAVNSSTTSTAATNQATTATNQNTGGGGSHNNMQPSSFFNVMIKL